MNKNFLRVRWLLVLCAASVTLAGCATIGALGGGLYHGFIGVVHGLLGVIRGLGNILGKLPSF